MRKSCWGKLQVTAFFLATALLLPISHLSRKRHFALDPYKRYQEELWVSSILETGHLQETGYGPNILSELADQAIQFPLNSVLLSEITLITNVDITELAVLPLYTLPFFLIIGSISLRVTGWRWSLPISVFIIGAYQFKYLMFTSYYHRGFIAWLLFFVLILLLLTLRKRNSITKTIPIAIVVIAFTLSDHTLPLSSLFFFFPLAFFSNFYSKSNEGRLFSFQSLAIITTIVLFYYGIIFNWIQGIIIGIFTTNLSGIDFWSFVRTKGGSQSILSPYLSSFDLYSYHPLYIIASITSRAIAALTVIGIGLSKFRKLDLWNNPQSMFNILFLCFAIQIISFFMVSPLFADSGGINPRLLGIFTFSIFAPYAIANIWSRTENHLILALLLILFVLPAGIVTMWQPVTPTIEDSTSTESEVAQLTWVASYNEGQVTSDFLSLSALISIGDRSPIYLPTGNTVADRQQANNLVEHYYTNPSSRSDFRGLYIINERLKKKAIYHLGALKTKPNPTLEFAFINNPGWNKVYDTGEGENYIAKN